MASLSGDAFSCIEKIVMRYFLKVLNENKMLQRNVRELQGQLQKAYIRIKELTDKLNGCKVQKSNKDKGET